MKRLCILLSLALLASCFQAYDDDEAELRTVPVTNNPTLVPNYGMGAPGGAY